MKHLITLITICLFCLASLSFAAKIYKWTDSEGNIHYGEHPPAGQAEQIKVPHGPAAPAPAAQPSTQQGSTQKLLDAFAKERKDKQEASTKSAAEKALRERNCSSAKRRIAGLKLGGRQFEMTDSGEQHFLSEAEVQSRIEEAQKYADKWCK